MATYEQDVWMLSSGSREMVLTGQSVAIAVIILIISLAIVVSNTTLIITVVSVPGPKDVINYYILSLAISDLLVGLLVAPVSVYPALTARWLYGDFACHLVSYIMVTLWAAQAFTLMWISVDRYLAIIKPLRYDTIQTKVRSQCWMAVSWLSAMVLCSPPLLGFSSSLFDADAYICISDWSDMIGYSSTVALMVLGPPAITTAYTYSYIFQLAARLKSTSYLQQLDKEYVSAVLENLSNPNIVMSLVLTLLFWISWMPFLGLRLYEFFAQETFDMPFLHFGLFWFGMMNSVWKVVICFIACGVYRRVFCVVLHWFCCLCRRHMSPVNV